MASRNRHGSLGELWQACLETIQSIEFSRRSRSEAPSFYSHTTKLEQWANEVGISAENPQLHGSRGGSSQVHRNRTAIENALRNIQEACIAIRSHARRTSRLAQWRQKLQNMPCPEEGELGDAVEKVGEEIEKLYLLIPLNMVHSESKQSQPVVRLSIPPSESVSNLASDPSVVEDLLKALSGIEGASHVRFTANYDTNQERYYQLHRPRFRSMTPNEGLFHVIRPTLNIANQLYALQNAVDGCGETWLNDLGQVNLAFCNSIKVFLKETRSKIAQLQLRPLTIHDLQGRLGRAKVQAAVLYYFAARLLIPKNLTGRGAINCGTTTSARAQDTRPRSTTHSSTDSSSGIYSDIPSNFSGDFESTLISNNKDSLASIWNEETLDLPSRGGNALSFLSRRLKSQPRNPRAAAFLNKIYQDMSQPYMAMLNRWLQSGDLCDPHLETFIRKPPDVSESVLELALWAEFNERYSQFDQFGIETHYIPTQLKGQEKIIRETGKIMACARKLGAKEPLEMGDFPKTLDSSLLSSTIRTAYTRANQILLDLLFGQHQLFLVLQSLKLHFLCLLVTEYSGFLKTGAAELIKKKKDANIENSWFQEKCRPEYVRLLDPYPHDVALCFGEKCLEQMIRDLDAATRVNRRPPSEDYCYRFLELHRQIPFAASIVLGRAGSTKYQCIFKILVSLRILELNLVDTWQEFENKFLGLPAVLLTRVSRVSALQTRMLHFAQITFRYCCMEVIEPRWEPFSSRLFDLTRESAIQARITVRDLWKEHRDVITNIMTECLLMHVNLTKAFLAAVECGADFVTLTRSFIHAPTSRSSELFNTDEPSPALNYTGLSSEGPSTDNNMENFSSELKVLERSFNDHLATMLELLGRETSQVPVFEKLQTGLRHLSPKSVDPDV
ncbi:spc97 spc98 family protein [Pochonia chlamydosporia 170]|uniref:Spindle pole body component n=1 Tax=Pochonia chlamydosporia 170 TaxID=1380566 RepID=A0A179FRT3_METCM|nr:spc97 spc98 family protein [Pochonia chlamydosporia 170]OAQ67910.1 spc97 spc98 family protein [Pochonia chlamydosporia 170]